MNWYEDHDPLCVKIGDGTRTAFHEWIATIQVVSAIKMLPHLRQNATTEDAIRKAIATAWRDFVYGTWNDQVGANVGGVLQEKQNTTTHWAKQKEWIGKLIALTGVAPVVTSAN